MKNFRPGIQIKFQCSCGKRVLVEARLQGEGNCPRCKQPLHIPSSPKSEDIILLCSCGVSLVSSDTHCSSCKNALYIADVVPLQENSQPLTTRLNPLKRRIFFVSISFFLLLLVWLSLETVSLWKGIIQRFPSDLWGSISPFSEPTPLESIPSKTDSIEKIPLKPSMEKPPISSPDISLENTDVPPVSTTNHSEPKPTTLIEKKPVLKKEPIKNKEVLPPVAKIQGLESVFFQQGVFVLDGRLSSDPQELSLDYYWSLVDKPLGSKAQLQIDGPICSLNPDHLGFYRVQLVVHNGKLTAETILQLEAKLKEPEIELPPPRKIAKEPETEKEEIPEIPEASPRMQKMLEQLKLKQAEKVLDTLDEIAQIAASPISRLEASSALESVLPFLQSRVWQVRSAAAYALGFMERFEAIMPLIERLKKEKGRPAAHIREALTQITTLDFGEDAERWKKFWEANQGHFVRPKENHAPEAGGSFYGVTIISDRIIFVVDTSGSMSASAGYQGEEGETVVGAGARFVSTRLDVAKKELSKQIKRFNPRIAFNVIFFDSGVRPCFSRLVPGSASNIQKTLAFTEQQQPNGGTNIHDSLMEAIADEQVDTIILLTDGAPSAGKIMDTKGILEAIREVNRFKRIKIYTIGIEAFGAEEFLKSLAQQNFGSYHSK